MFKEMNNRYIGSRFSPLSCHHTVDNEGKVVKVTDCGQPSCPTSDTNPKKQEGNKTNS